MARTIGIGHQDFAEIIRNNLFYIDKTRFIEEWWENNDSVTLITRPRRFGKTLTMSMTERFFSVIYAGDRDIFERLEIWKKEKYRKLQGTYPVISLSFANVKEADYVTARQRICQLLTELYNRNTFLLNSGVLTEEEIEYFRSIDTNMPEVTATMAVYKMSDFLSRYYGKKVIILLDEYDTPMQEAYVQGYWAELAGFTRSLFHASFKTNPFMERAIMTGITRVGKESVFSDLNNLVVVTTTSSAYADSFGFTEEEMTAALEEFGISDKKPEVKEWYDGFTFGEVRDIYNPWSITNYLRFKKLAPYWANTSSNSMISSLLRRGGRSLKMNFESLLRGDFLEVRLDEQIVFSQLGEKESAVWSLLLASGYLKVLEYIPDTDTGRDIYKVVLTNKEVQIMFRRMIHGWFADYDENYNDFIRALLSGNVRDMNHYMRQVAMSTFSFFDVGGTKGGRSGKEPERFYHGFVLGLMVELAGRYRITSNRESGFGRYDILLEALHQTDDAIIIEFKVQDTEEERCLEDTVSEALHQIEEKEYAAELTARGIEKTRIRNYGFAFCGKQVLIGTAE